MKSIMFVLVILLLTCSPQSVRQEKDSGNLFKEVEFDPINQIEHVKYYTHDTLYLVETTYDEGVIDLNVTNEYVFYKLYFDAKKKKYAGVSLYSIYCFKCHPGQPFLRDSFDIDNFSKVDSLSKLLLYSKHSTVDSLIVHELNCYEIEAICSYIKGNSTGKGQ